MRIAPSSGLALLLAIPAASPAIAQLVLDLSPSQHNGFNVSCNAGQDGAIDLTISGGTPPYTVEWSTGATTEDVANLPAGYCRVGVSDNVGNFKEAEITLTEPEKLTAELVPFEWGNGYNVSCFQCYNGSIDLTVAGGVQPFGYAWSDGATTQDRSSLGSDNYYVNITDANGCVTKAGEVYLREPASNDWKMSGNAGTSPGTHYLGTSDNKDVVFKTNNAERLTLLSTGEARASSLAFPIGYRLLVADAQGTLKLLTDGGAQNEYYEGCPRAGSMPWTLCGNNVAPDAFLGTLNERTLTFKTYGESRMWISSDGKIIMGMGAGTSSLSKLTVKHADERGGMALMQTDPGPNTHSEIRFMKGSTERWALGCDFDADGGQDFFLWDAGAGNLRIIVDEQGKVGIGTVPPSGSSSLYRLYVDEGIVTRDVKVTINAFPDHVFEPSYELMSLDALERYLKEHRHLPGMPSATEVAANAGVEVGDLQVRMLTTVEEQALYILEIKREVETLKQQVSALQAGR